MSIVIEIINILFWFVVILIPLVVIHEFGHLIMARLNGVKVIEFGVGIPPRAIYRKWKGIIWSLNWVMLGGFAKIYGDHDALDEAKEQSKLNPKLAKEKYIEDRLQELVVNQELEFFLKDNQLAYDKGWREFDNSKFLSSDDQDYSKEKIEEYTKKQDTLVTLARWEYENKLDSGEAFFNKNIFQKTLILLGGIIFNLATAIIIFIIFFGFIGSPLSFVPFGGQEGIEDAYKVSYQSDEVQVLTLDTSGAAYAAGLRPQDTLLSISGQDINELGSFDDFKQIIDESRGESVSMVYVDNDSGEKITTDLEIEEEGSRSKFGVGSNAIGYPATLKSKTFFGAVQESFSQTWFVLTENFKALGRIVMAPFTQDEEALEQVGGPVLVGSIGNDIFELQGVKGILNAMAFISISLAAFNLLPLPALDGGRMVIIYINRILGKRNKKLEASVITATMLLLLAAGVLIAFKDIQTLR